MAVVRILQYPDPRLRTVGEAVQDVHAPAVQQMVKDILDTIRATPNCGGLAACQLDFQTPKRIIVTDLSSKKKKLVCMINPEIIAQEGEVHEPEGCMSVYETFIKVKRAAVVTVRYLTPEGKTKEERYDGYTARCVQHEIDHLNGVLNIDYLSKIKRERIRHQIMKAQKRQKH